MRWCAGPHGDMSLMPCSTLVTESVGSRAGAHTTAALSPAVRMCACCPHTVTVHAVHILRPSVAALPSNWAHCTCSQPWCVGHEQRVQHPPLPLVAKGGRPPMQLGRARARLRQGNHVPALHHAPADLQARNQKECLRFAPSTLRASATLPHGSTHVLFTG